MEKPTNTREKLLRNARQLFWYKGYSNVSLRQISAAAGVDVSLVSRHFGGKLGLFEATLEGAFDVPDLPETDTAALVDLIVRVFVGAPRDSGNPSSLRMLLTNADDDEVGGLVRELHANTLQHYLDGIIGNRAAAAMFMAAILGFSVAEKSLHLSGIPAPSSKAYETQLRHLLNGALAYSDT